MSENKNMAVFEDYSKYYDLLYADKDYAAEVEYVHALIQREVPGATTILNLGCGTGMHDALLAKIGYKVTAIDLSETMVAVARQNYSDLTAIQFHVSDLRTFRNDRQFDVVLSLFHVMSYQVENSDLSAAFETARLHLKEGGVFLFDCWYGPGVLSDPPHNRLKEVEDEHLKIVRNTTAHSDVSSNSVNVIFDIEILNKQSDDRFKLREEHRMRYLFEPEIRFFGDSKGLKLTHSYKWMTQDLPKLGDWYVLNILKYREL